MGQSSALDGANAEAKAGLLPHHLLPEEHDLRSEHVGQHLEMETNR